MSHSYPSDITRKQFSKIKPILESIRKKTRPRTIDLYDIFCGVLYILKSGCQWRMLPNPSSPAFSIENAMKFCDSTLHLDLYDRFSSL